MFNLTLSGRLSGIVLWFRIRPQTGPNYGDRTVSEAITEVL